MILRPHHPHSTSPRRRIVKIIVAIGAMVAIAATALPVAYALTVDAPASCTFSRAGDQATVRFEPSKDADAAFHIIERNRNNLGWGWADRIDPNEEPVHVNRVKASDTVSFRVAALSADRTSSAQVNCQEQSSLLPARLAPVKKLKVTATTATSVTVAWEVDNDPRHVAYDFFVNNRYVGYDPDESATTHTFNDLEPGKTYRLGVTVTGDPNADWPGKSYSKRINIKAATDKSTPLPDRLAPVKKLQATATSATSVTVAWEVDRDPRHVSYDFFVNNRYVGYDPDETATTHTFNDLEPGKTYTLGVTVTGDPNADWPGKSYSKRVSIKAATGANQTEKVVWRDDFDSLDTSVWKLENESIYGIKSAQCYLDDNVAIRDGNLVLTAKKQDVLCNNRNARSFTSGMVRSRGVTFGVGQAIEFRVKLTPSDHDHQSGLWPALWVSGMGGGWPWGGEIDFLEVMTAIDPTRSVYSMHYSKTAPPKKTHAQRSKALYHNENFSERWHVIRFENRLGHLRWIIDGEEFYNVTSAPTYQGWPKPFDLPAREIRMNLTLGGEPNNKPTFVDPRGVDGATFMIDYVQISELTS